MSGQLEPLELLYEALNSEYGLIIDTANAEQFKQKLYQARKTDEALACLSFHVSPIDPATKIFIVRKEVQDASEE